nr:alkaline phosphatase [Geodermatophilaceae bacterium]
MTQDDVRTADLAAYNGMAAELRAAGVRIFGPDASVAQDLEPEYVAISPDSRTAYATLQENNAMATVDLATATVTDIVSLGARSFTIRDTEGRVVFDSGSAFERITAAILPAQFNSTNSENDSVDSRSDDKGPEPEGIEIGRAFGATYAFIGLERIGGVMTYDLSNPTRPRFVDYVNNRDFSGDAEAGTAGDLGPEGLTFITAANSPTGGPLLVVA